MFNVGSTESFSFRVMSFQQWAALLHIRYNCFVKRVFKDIRINRDHSNKRFVKFRKIFVNKFLHRNVELLKPKFQALTIQLC